MTALISDDELRTALDAVKVRWQDFAGSTKGSNFVGRVPAGAPEALADATVIRATYQRLAREAAQRWGLVR